LTNGKTVGERKVEPVKERLEKATTEKKPIRMVEIRKRADVEIDSN
jgi:hypothetical protein